MIYALLKGELPPRALMDVTPDSPLAEVRAAVLSAFKQPGSPDAVRLSKDGQVFAASGTLGESGVEREALIEAELDV